MFHEHFFDHLGNCSFDCTMHVCIVINRQMITYMYSIVSNTVWKRIIKLLEIQWQLHIGWRPVVQDFYIDNDLHQNDK